MSDARKNLFIAFLLALILPGAVVLSTHLAGRTFEKVRMRSQTVGVKGTAETKVRADRAAWGIKVTVRGKDLPATWLKLVEDRRRLQDKLAQLGLPEKAVSLAGPASTAPQFKRDEDGHETHEIEGYVIAQELTVASAEVDKVAKAATEVDALAKDGVELEASNPQYFIADLSATKLDLIAKATANARERAGQLIGNSGIRLGTVCSANQGVFQVVRPDSVDSSAGGEYDTSSKDKVVKAVVTLEYAIE